MASTPLLGLSLPADGTTNWGTLVNTSITALLDSAVAGTTTLSSDADVTLTATTEATNQARQAILLCTGARAAVRTITAPAQSKTYVIINATSGSYGVKIVGVGPTTGVTVPNGKAYMVAWNGSDFVAIGTTTVNLATDVTGTLPITNGGTGQTTQQNAINALAGSVTSGKFLRGDGTNVTMSDIQPNDLPYATDTTRGATKLITGVAYTGSIVAPTTDANRMYGLQADAVGTGIVNVPWTDTTYGTATSTVQGLIKLGSNTAQTVAANAVTATASRTYAVQLTSGGNAVVNVPWTDTNSGGTVTSVAGTGTVSGLSLSGTVTTSGNITLGGTLAVTPSNFATQTANYVLAGPTTGSAAAPTFRALVAADIPSAININGTVGATTPDVGTFTRLRTGSSSTSGSGTLTPASDTQNQANYQLNGITTFDAPSGTPANSQKLIIRIYSAAAYALTWNAIYRVIGTTLPTTTVAGKTIYVGCIYNSDDTKWDVVSVTTQV